MCFTVQLSMFVAISDSFDILSCCFLFVKNFFNFFQVCFSYFLRSNFDILPQLISFVNSFLILFQTLFAVVFHRNSFCIISFLSNNVNPFFHFLFFIFFSVLKLSFSQYNPMSYRSWQVQMFVTWTSALTFIFWQASLISFRIFLLPFFVFDRL